MSLEALYTINKKAKEYAEKGTTQYRNGKKTTAKKNSVRKNALYDVKSSVLEQEADRATEITKHRIDGNLFYCLYFDDVDFTQQISFHVPVDEVELEPTQDDVETLEDFTSGSEQELTNMCLKQALLTLQDEYGVNANEHLSMKFLSYGRNSYFVGWKYLD